jgi:hypothetical protein
MAKLSNAGFGTRLKLALLLLSYPGLAWLLANMSGADIPPSNRAAHEILVARLNSALYLVAGIGFLFLAAVPVWSSRYRKRPQVFAAEFRRGLLITSALIAVLLPLQGVLSAFALYLADPTELWIWGIFTSGGAIFGTIALLRSGLGKQPGIYLTLRAARIQLDQHPKLATMLRELGETNQVPVPPHILVGLQPELFWTIGTVFCPDGELEGGALCLSLPTSSILSVAEFRALTGQALLGLQAGLTESRTQFLSTTEAAKDALKDLDDTMARWSWRPRLGFYPPLVIFWFALVASMRFPLIVGKELLTYYLKEFWISRQVADVIQSVDAHRSSAEEVGAVQVISAIVKEAAVSLGLLFKLYSEGDDFHALGEVAKRAAQEHPELRFERRASAYRDPVSAWRYLQFRCSLSGVSLEWCRQMALNVSPEPSASSFFENASALQAKLVELADSPFVSVKR